MMNQKQIGRYIAEKRRIKNLTQAQLAEQLGISDKTVSKWECGRSMPDYALIQSLCETLDISVSELIEGKKLLFVDDSIVRGTQLRETVEFLYESGAAEVVVTDTLPIPAEKRFDQLTVLSIAPLLARAIHEVFEDGSVTSLFN